MPGIQDLAGVAGTARWIAAARARESARPDRLFDDPWAGALAGSDGFEMLDEREPDGLENPFLPVRTRFFDDLLVTASRGAGNATHQVVLLGAGFDTRAYRLRLPTRTTVYELDQPDVLTAKRAVLDGVVPLSGRRPVPADLRADWAEPLLEAGFDPAIPTAWIAEGVLFYLGDVEVHTLLRTAASLSAGAAVFGADTFGTGLLRLPGLRALVENRRSTGACMPFCTDEPRTLLVSCGWRAEHVLHVGEPGANFGRLTPIPSHGYGENDPTMRSYLLVGTRSANNG